MCEQEKTLFLSMVRQAIENKDKNLLAETFKKIDGRI